MSSQGERGEADLKPTVVVELAPSFQAEREQKRALLEEQRAGWEAGRPPSPEELLRRWPADAGTDPDVASLLFEDLLQRRRHGEPASVEDYAARFPRHRDSLARLLARQDALRSLGEDLTSGPGAGVSLGLPEAGDLVFGFRLCRELGRGAFARVFLAEQAELAGRPVVLKVSAIEGKEPQTLAQLQHTHIVPIYSVHEDARAGLRAVCMPYFGGASLSEVLKALWGEGGTPTRGAELVRALQAVQAPPPEEVRGDRAGDGAGDRAPLDLLAETTYIRAVCWLMVRLAEGLQHAHQRRILHRDVKPSNVLLGADGQPLLLDFNLALDQRGGRVTLGGTVAYMAPEHLRAVAERSPALARQVDHRADVYSLGMVFFEMLTGQSPFDQKASYSALPLMVQAMSVERSKGTPSLRAARPDCAWGLESILRLCLAPDPARRYQQAEHLAEDLTRFLDDRPLRHAPELSRAERLRKWGRRHPRLTAAASVAAAAVLLLTGTGGALWAVSGRLEQAEERLGVAEARERRQTFESGTVRALCLLNTTLDMQDHLAQGVSACERTLALYGLADGDAWREPADWAALKQDERRRLAEDARELLLLLAGARVRLALNDRAALCDALRLLDRAEAVGNLPPSQALWQDRARYLERLGEAERARAAARKAAETPATSARDRYLLAGAYARQGTRDGYLRAVAELNRALEQNPRHYWSWVQRGLCRQELKEHVLAAGDFGTCVGLWPEFGWGFFCRGWLFDATGRKAEAVEDYTAALKRDPGLAPAYLNRGLACLELKRPADALADFDRALALGKDEPALHAGRGIALEGLKRHPEADAAFAAALKRTATAPPAVRARVLWTYGFAVADRLPEKARAAFDEVLQHDPSHAQALYGCGLLAARRNRDVEALRHFHAAVEADGSFLVARRYRALLLARAGHFKAALEDINWCLEREPEGSQTLYTAACIAARAAGRFGGAQATDQALEFLGKALARGVPRDGVARDPDLAAVRTDPRFRKLAAP
ncbi:MAG: protein kinase [Gemmataceae bacterium]|nr:protein kinase [Gemmataceae bacterium]